MKTTIISCTAIILLGLAASVYFIRREFRSAPSRTTTTISIDSSRTTHISNPATFLTSSTEIPVPVKIDTAEIIRKYHMAHYFHQTIRDTTADILAEISDSIRFNMLTFREVNLRNLRATQIITTVYDTCKPYKAPLFQPYVGARVGITRPMLSQATPFIGVKIRGKWHLDYGYNFIGREHQVSAARDILMGRR